MHLEGPRKVWQWPFNRLALLEERLPRRVEGIYHSAQQERVVGLLLRTSGVLQTLIFGNDSNARIRFKFRFDIK